MMFTPHQSKFFSHFLTREEIDQNGGLAQSLSSARVDLNPHQVDAATFALRSPLSKGVLLADEVGLGKTIEAALVLSQRWWERQRNLLLIVPASLRKQWATELRQKFSLPSVILDAKQLKTIASEGRPNPIGRGEGIIIVSYEYAARIADSLRKVAWSLVVFDEAHKLRNVYRAAETSRAAILRDALVGRQKLLLTATPLQNNLMELYGLISIIDDTYFGSEQAFRAEFGGREEVASQALLARRLEPICKRTLRRQVQKIGLINYTNRHPKTFDFTPAQLETDLYDMMSAYLQRTDTIALGQNGRHLVTLVLRKILGSSSFAVAQTLDKMVRRLETRRAVNDESGAGFTRDFRNPPERLTDIKRHIFSGFSKGCYQLAKFDSDTERKLSVLLEQEPTVRLWMKPGPNQFKIYDTDGMPYQPDFVVETDTTKLIIESKANNQMSDPVVLRKADAASLWCHIATEVHGKKTGDKPWRYLLVPESAVQPNSTITGLVATYSRSPDAELLSRFDLS